MLHEKWGPGVVERRRACSPLKRQAAAMTSRRPARRCTPKRGDPGVQQRQGAAMPAGNRWSRGGCCGSSIRARNPPATVAPCTTHSTNNTLDTSRDSRSDGRTHNTAHAVTARSHDSRWGTGADGEAHMPGAAPELPLNWERRRADDTAARRGIWA